MKKFLALPIRIHMFLLVILLALPSAGVIIHAGLAQRKEAHKEAAKDSARLVYAISSEITTLVRSAEQLADTLAHLPSVQRLDKSSMNPLLAGLIQKYPQYSNIIITDSSGLVLASGLPIKQAISLAERKVFKEAKVSGRFSAGEYLVGRLVHKPIISFAYPIKDAKGTFKGVIGIAVDLGHTRHLLEKVSLHSGGEYVLLDHKGTFLYRTFEVEKYIGTPVRSDILKTMVDGPDEATAEFTSNQGIRRVSSYRKLRLSDNQPPYMYVRAGYPLASVMASANASLLEQLALLTPFFFITLCVAWFISKHVIVDRIAALQDASRRLAGGEFNVLASGHVTGSELGELAKTFDDMARSLADREQILKESEAKFRSLFESMQEGVVISEIVRDEQGAPADFRCIDVNPACENILKSSRNQIIGRTLVEIFSGSGRMGIEFFREVALTGVPRHFEEYHADTDTYFEVHSIRPETGHLAIIFSDISEQKRMQDERIRNERLESLGVLAGGIAHDFNNFLTGILGNVTLARMQMDASHKAHKLLGEAEKATHRAAELASQLLTFARGGAPIKKVISIQQLLRDSAALVLRGTNVKAVLEIPETLQNVEADEGQIAQAFHNIILNASQAMPEGGILTITASDAAFAECAASPPCSGDYLKVSFEDVGCGISPENLERIFDPYFTTKPDGTGLGLASAYSIITRHGGQINVLSTVGKGTTFELYLPASRKNIHDSAGTDNTTAPDKRIRKGRILIMDDDEAITSLLVDIFEDMGYSVETCSHGAEAIAIYRDALERGIPHDAVIMDLTIPGGMGGKEAATHLLQLDSNACLIASSGYSNDPVMSDYRSYGFRAAIAKPYAATEISRLLDAAFAGDRRHA